MENKGLLFHEICVFRFSVLLRGNEVLEPLWWAYYPSGSGNLLIIMDWLIIMNWSVGPVVAAEGLMGWWVGRTEAISLADAVWVGVLEELVLRTACISGRGPWGCMGVCSGWAAGRNWARSRLSTKRCRSRLVYCWWSAHKSKGSPVELDGRGFA